MTTPTPSSDALPQVSASADSARPSSPATVQALPPALRAWHAWLQWFPHESALAIGGMLPRLDAALGRYRGTLQRGTHTPNGIDELRRRGPYHRLLLSEWALADEAPDEFLRRASSGEHLFLSPRYETIKADAQIVAVFDAGPAQFGAPRLAHIALWILLARRAEQAGIGFRWGILGAPSALDSGGDAFALKRLLNARSLAHADTTKTQAWCAALDADDCEGGERWLIAGARDAIDGFSHRVRVVRDLQRNLAVRIVGPNGQRDVDVPLPPEKASARLLRGAFSFEVATTDMLGDADTLENKEKLSLRQPPLIAPAGGHIAVPLLGESAAMVYAMTATGRHTAGSAPKRRVRKMRWASGSELMCAAMSRKGFGGIVADAHHLYFWQIEGFGVMARPSKDELKATPGQAHWPACLWFNSGRRPHHLMLLDDAQRLLSFVGNNPGVKNNGVAMETIDDGVIAIARADDEHLAYLRYRRQTVELMLRHRTGSMSKRLAYAPSTDAPDKGFIVGSPHPGNRTGAWCVRTQRATRDGGASVWTLYPIARTEQRVEGDTIQVQAGWHIVGLVAVPNTPSEYGLVAIAANRKRLMLLRESGSDTLYASARNITAASVGTDCDLIALITEDRQLVALTPGGESQHWNADAVEDDDG